MKEIKMWMKKAAEKKKWYMDSYTEFSDGLGKLYDYQVADYAKKHLRFIDRLNIRKVTTAAMLSFHILSKNIEEPNLKNGRWKFYIDF